jgi:hypothetical protein
LARAVRGFVCIGRVQGKLAGSVIHPVMIRFPRTAKFL